MDALGELRGGEWFGEARCHGESTRSALPLKLSDISALKIGVSKIHLSTNAHLLIYTRTGGYNEQSWINEILVRVFSLLSHVQFGRRGKCCRLAVVVEEPKIGR